MLAVLGSACTASAIVAIALLSLAFNHPKTPRLLRAEVVVFLRGVVVTIALGVGLGCLAVTGRSILAGSASLAEFVAAAVALALIVLVLRTLKLGARLESYRVAALPLPPPAA